VASSTLLTDSQIQQLWIANGGPASAAPMAAAIALAESGGCATSVAGAGCGGNPAKSTDRNGGSYGLWQINGSHAGVNGAAPASGGPVPPSSWINSMFNPAANAKEAVALSQNGTNWNPWSTYKNGAYQKYLNGAGPSNAVLASSAASNTGGDLSTCVFQAPGFLFFSGPCFLTKGGVKWLKGVSLLVGGSLLGAFGVVMLAAYGFEASGSKAALSKTSAALGHPVKAVTGRAKSQPAKIDEGQKTMEKEATASRRRYGAGASQRSVKMEDVDKAASEEREHQEGFPGYNPPGRSSGSSRAKSQPSVKQAGKARTKAGGNTGKIRTAAKSAAKVAA
jgi:hypothetical protein